MQKGGMNMKTFKVILTILLWLGTLAAGIGIMIFFAEFTVFYLICYGIILAVMRYEFKCIWDKGPIELLVKKQNPRHKGRH